MHKRARTAVLLVHSCMATLFLCFWCHSMSVTGTLGVSVYKRGLGPVGGGGPRRRKENKGEGKLAWLREVALCFARASTIRATGCSVNPLF